MFEDMFEGMFKGMFRPMLFSAADLVPDGSVREHYKLGTSLLGEAGGVITLTRATTKLDIEYTDFGYIPSGYDRSATCLWRSE